MGGPAIVQKEHGCVVSQRGKVVHVSGSVPSSTKVVFAARKKALTSWMIGFAFILSLASTEAWARPLRFVSTQLTRFEEAVKMLWEEGLPVRI